MRCDARIGSLAILLGLAMGAGGCSSTPPAAGQGVGGGAAGTAATAGTAGAAGPGGAAGNAMSEPDGGGLGNAGGAATDKGSGGDGGAAGEMGQGGTGGSTGGAGGIAGRGSGGSGQGGTSTGGVAGGGGACALPSTVSFQKDVQPFLMTTCGGGNGCHVIDAASTTSSGGYDHAYDWITAGAHPSSCPETPTPKRFQVVLDVIAHANPPTCSKSRIMPPSNETGANLRKPLTTCQVALLQGWLDEPLVTQAHRVDDTDPAGTAPFPMPPFN